MYKEYFKEIFQSSKTVIIPGLGSFTKLNEQTINFNPYLKFNDGYLAGFIAKKQGISIDEAGKSIADSVEKIQDALTQKGEAMVLGLGVLRKSADGKVEFSTDSSIQNTNAPDVKKVEPLIQKEIPKPVVEPQKEKPVIPPVTNIPKPVIEKPVEKVDIKTHDVKVNAPKLTEVANEKKDKNLDKVAKEEEAKKLKLAKEEEAKKSKLLKDEAAKKAKQQKEEAARQAKEAKEAAKILRAQTKGEKKKSKFPVWLVLVLVLVLGGGTFTFLKWDMVKGWLGMNKAKTEEPKKDIAQVEEAKAEPIADTMAVDTALAVEEQPVVEETKEEPVKQEKIVPVKVKPVTNGNFHVITGNFQSQTLADGMVSKLNAEGNQAVNLGNRGGFFMVSAGSFSTLEEANAKRQSISTAHPKAYIYNGL